MIPASKFKRCVAYMIDVLILMTPMFVILFISLSFVPENKLILITEKLITKSIFMIGCLLYFALFESSKYQASPGKKLLNLYVSDNNNQRLSFQNAFKRSFLCMLPGLLINLIEGYIHDFTDLDPDANNEWIIFLIIFWVIWCTPIFFHNARKTIYDVISATRVNSKIADSKQLRKDLEDQRLLISALQERLHQSNPESLEKF